MRQTDLAWAAGIVDGEGCILLYRAKTRTGDAWVLRLTVINTSQPMLQRLQEIFQLGSVRQRRRTNPRHKVQWTWEIAARKAEAALILLLPYLVTKRREAELGLTSRRLIRPLGINTPNPNLRRLATLKRQLSALKH